MEMKLEANQEKTIQKCDSVQEEIKNSLEKTIAVKLDEFKSMNTQAQDAINTSLNKNVEHFREKGKTFGDETSKIFNEQTEKIETDFYQIKDSISEGNESLVKKFKDILEDVKERFLEKIVDQVKRLRTDTANLEKTLSETLDERTDTYRSEIDSARQEFFDGVDGHVKNLDTQSHAIRDESVTKLLASIITNNKDALKTIQTNRNTTISSHKTTLAALQQKRRVQLYPRPYQSTPCSSVGWGPFVHPGILQNLPGCPRCSIHATSENHSEMPGFRAGFPAATMFSGRAPHANLMLEGGYTRH